ncbi:MAG: transposase family protein [Opitutaceae bacterium]
MSNLNSLRETLARKQAELASLEEELRSAQAAQFTGLPAQLGLESIDAVIKALAPHASPRLKGALAKAFGGKLPAPVAVEAPVESKPAPAPKGERRKRTTVTPELKDAIVQALQAGKTATAVAEECGVSPATVNNIKRAAGLTKKREEA